MDRDLELVGRGEPVGTETEAAATMVLRGETTAATTVRPVPAGFGGDERYRSYDGEVRTGRAWWPWLLAVGVAIALGIAGWFVYDDVRDRIDANEPVAVDNYTGILEQNAVDLIVGDGFEAKVVRRPNADVQPRYVFQQEPEPGTRLPKDSIVTVIVSTGKPKVSVPFVVGKSRDTAVAELTQRDLEATVVEVNSERQSGIVTAQNPRAGTVLVSGASVRINVSKGPKPIAVPSVVGSTYELAAAQLQSAGFTVGRVDVESNAPPAPSSPEPAGQLDGDARLARDALRLARPVDRERAGRLVPERRGRARHAARRGLPRRRHAAGDGRRDARRHRDLAGPAGLEPGRPRCPRDAHRRDVRPAAGRDDAADHDQPGPDDDDSVSGRVRVAVLAGGRSSEHEISLASAAPSPQPSTPSATR